MISGCSSAGLLSIQNGTRKAPQPMLESFTMAMDTTSGRPESTVVLHDRTEVDLQDMRSSAQRWRRHIVRCYLIYCIICFVVMSALSVAVFGALLLPSQWANWWRRELRPYEEVGEVVACIALCIEMIVAIRALGLRAFICDR